jgi:CRISPR system Cascade subunit CasA
MPISFNLLDEPFVPVYGADGRNERSLRDVLILAHEIREMRDASPLATLALHRLLLAILHRNFGPTSPSQWQQLWEAGRFPAAPLEAYFKKCHDKFDLFDKTQPFFQDSAFRTKEPNGINQLVRELCRGNNATLFDHTSEDPPPLLTPAEVARALIAEQAFAVGGGKSELGYTTSAPLIGGVAVLVGGENLFETLMLNLVRYDHRHPIAGGEGDAPAWERGGLLVDGAPSPDGYLDYLTWQSRSIHLHPEPDGKVRFMSYAQGRKLDSQKSTYDPMVAYRRDKEKGDVPIRLSEAKALWRDSAALFQFAETDAFRGPANLRWLHELKDAGAIPGAKGFTLAAFGLCTDKAKVKFWRQETLPLPLAYLTDKDLVRSLQDAIDLAEAVGRDAVRSAAKTVASRLLAPGKRSPDKNQLRATVDSIGADALFWSRLELPFREFLIGLPGDSRHQKEQIDSWFRETLDIAQRAFQQTAGQLDRTGRAMRAFVDGERQLFLALSKIKKKYRIEQPFKQGATS